MGLEIVKNESSETDRENRKRPAKPSTNGSGFPPLKKRVGGGGEKGEGGKPDWKKLRKERKALKESRKKKEMRPEFYLVTKKAKEVWEELRKASTPAEERSRMCEKLTTLIQPYIKKFSNARDLTRILESLLTHGSEANRTTVFEEFKSPEDTVALFTSKYGHFVALKLLKYTSVDQKTLLLANVKPQIAHLVKNRYSAIVLNEFYLHYATAEEKAMVIKQCYGPSLQTLSDASETLSEVFEKHPEKKPHILKYVSEMTWARKLDPGIFKANVILQRLLYEYLQNCEPSDCTNVLELIKNEVGSIYKTKEGSLLGVSCIWNGTPKDRKLIVKSLKGMVCQIACDKFGYRVILALLDVVDDTVLLSKAICPEITNNLNEIMMNEFGQRVLAYILAHRSPYFFDPHMVKHLKLGDSNPYTKKPVDVRIHDISESMFSSLVEAVSSDFGIWLQNNSACLIVQFILTRFAEKNIDSALQKVAEEIASVPTDMGIERKAVDQLVKQVFIKLSESQKVTFADKLLKHLEDADQMDEWLKTNRGCFAFLRILESCTSSTDLSKRVKIAVKKNKSVLSQNSSKMAGVKLLLEKC